MPALEKNSLSINFAQGLDQKTDPFQITPGKFLNLENSIFTKGGLLQKRNGYLQLPNLPTPASYATTFNGNLLAIGSTIQALSDSTNTWTNQGSLQPCEVSTMPLVRSSTAQTQQDVAVSANGLIGVAYTDQIPNSGSNVATYKFAVLNSTTGQQVIAPTVISAATTAPRIFALGNYLLVVFGAASNHLDYIAINTTSLSVSSPVTISSAFDAASALPFNGVVFANNLYLAWNGTDGGGAMRMAYITSTLVLSAAVVVAGYNATHVSMCADAGHNQIWTFFYDSVGQTAYAYWMDLNLSITPTVQQVLTTGAISHIACAAQNRIMLAIYETINAYSFDSTIDSNFTSFKSVNASIHVGAAVIVSRGMGLASNAFIVNGAIYFLGAYDAVLASSGVSVSYQPTYYLVNIPPAPGIAPFSKIVSRLAYSNAGGYASAGIPNVNVSGNTAKIGYLYKDLIQAINKTQGIPNTAGVYSQTGINMVTFEIGVSTIVTAEIGGDLHITGGFLWMYDGTSPVEQNFFLWPDIYVKPDNTYAGASSSTTGGNLTAQVYYYVFTYEWADNNGNTQRSAPSVPFMVDIHTSGTSTNSITINVPTLRQTYKADSHFTSANTSPVKIVGYRWSTGQPVYYQTTSLTVPIINNKLADSVQFIDTNADSSIVGNNILYTTGGVVEDISPPSTNIITLFDTRLWLVDAEDPNLLWYSKQVIEATPVEMSDLFTVYIAPNISAQGSTGPITALSPMDDKLIIFKKDAIYFIGGSGPDNTGAGSTYTPATFITANVGSIDQHSIVMMPNGLMFQSDKGIWLLDRSLGTAYIGAPVENSNAANVLSALAIPGTNQVRFTLDSGITLMYDYFYSQWGTFTGVPSISSTLYQSLHTFIDAYGRVFQESPGSYLDGSNPVLMSFQTGWMNLAGLQGFERAYYFYLLGTYISPHKLVIDISYDYAPAPSQTFTISPDNFSGAWGSDPVWGGSANWGGPVDLNKEQWRCFFTKGKVQSFQINLQENYDPSYGVTTGAGFTLHGLNLVVGAKKKYPTLRPAHSTG